MDQASRSQHIIELSKEIIDDIEFSRGTAQAILLKTTRLSRYVDNEEVRQWLIFEMQGYIIADSVSEKYMGKTGRWENKQKKEGCWSSLAQLDALIEAENIALNNQSFSNSSGTTSRLIIDLNHTRMYSMIGQVSRLNGIKSKVISLIHNFATNVYYEKIFDNLAESIFDSYKNEINLLIAENAGDILDQIPSVVSRLSDQDNESISQALTTCRRIIESFANHVFPASDQTIQIGGNELSLKADKTLNRINAFIHQHTKSDSRKKKLRQNLQNLYERVCAGVHSDVDAQEARNLFFNVYLLLGEILTLSKGI